MRLRRLRSGELLALGAALALGVFSFLPWYHRAGGGDVSAWDSFGVADVLLSITFLSALTLAVTTVAERSPAQPVASAVWTTWWGIVGSVAALVRLFDHPAHTSLAPFSWLSLIAVLLVLAGAWQSMRDERRELYPPAKPEPRPVPGSRTST